MSDIQTQLLEYPWTLGVMGLGYVGLPLAVAGTEAGLEVVGYDIDAAKVSSLNSGRSLIEDIDDDRLGKSLANGLVVTSQPQDLSRCQAILICVPTPLGPNRQPDLEPIQTAASTLATVARPDQIIVLESTTYPGTTEEVLWVQLESTGLQLDENLWVAYSPERISPGTGQQITDIPKVVGGLTSQSSERASWVYQRLGMETVEVSHARVAEMTKLMENTYRAVNIALVNEMAIIARQLDINIWETIEAAATKPFGYVPFFPGPGVGGHCIPLDPQFLSWRAREFGQSIRFIDLAEQINSQMPAYVVGRISEILNRSQLSLSKSKILALGMSYKPEVGDDRSSASVLVLNQLVQQGAEVEVADPYMSELAINSHGFTSCSLDSDLSSFDLAVVLTDHADFDYELVSGSVPVVFDTRGVYRRLGIKADNVVLL